MNDARKKETGRYPRDRATLAEIPMAPATPRQVARMRDDHTTDEKLLLLSEQLTETAQALAGISEVVLKLDIEATALASITSRLAEGAATLARTLDRIEKRLSQTERVVGLRSKGNGQ